MERFQRILEGLERLREFSWCAQRLERISDVWENFGRILREFALECFGNKFFEKRVFFEHLSNALQMRKRHACAAHFSDVKHHPLCLKSKCARALKCSGCFRVAYFSLNALRRVEWSRECTLLSPQLHHVIASRISFVMCPVFKTGNAFHGLNAIIGHRRC